MIEFLLAAPHSGSGKTVMTCALLAVLKQRGLTPCAFKCGPDYIDPMFHRAVLGVPSHNLDLFLADKPTVRQLFHESAAGHGAAVCEGAMGFYDGLGGSTDIASAWQVADVLGLPVLLVLRPKGASLTLAAEVQGLQSFRTDSHIAGILLNDCSPMLYQSLAPMLERETGLSVLGFLPHTEDALFESRHLGLCTAGEIRDLAARIERLAALAEEHIDMERLLCLCKKETIAVEQRTQKSATVTLAVAQDEAFCFTYAETLDAMRTAGAKIVLFSPLHDAALPSADGLYLPGGYPELHAEALSKNTAMRTAICAVVNAGMPTVAECGGFLFLGKTLQDKDGIAWPMAGVLPGNAANKGRLVRFGYAEITAKTDSLLFAKDEKTPVHEFHYWDTDANGVDFTAQKPLTGKSWPCGYANARLYAAFPHLYFEGNSPLSQRFVAAMAEYQQEKTNAYESSHEL